MSYIIVWRNSHRDPHVDVGSGEFIEKYSTYEDAKEEAEKVKRIENENEQSPWYFDYQIYQEVNN